MALREQIDYSRASGSRVEAVPREGEADSDHNGYGVVEFTPQQVKTQLRVVDDVRRKDTKIETLASFVVEAGESKVRRI